MELKEIFTWEKISSFCDLFLVDGVFDLEPWFGFLGFDWDLKQMFLMI